MTTNFFSLAPICYSFSNLKLPCDHQDVLLAAPSVIEFIFSPQSLQTHFPRNFPSGLCLISCLKHFWVNLGVKAHFDPYSLSSSLALLGPESPLCHNSHIFWVALNCQWQRHLLQAPSLKDTCGYIFFSLLCPQPPGVADSFSLAFLAHLSCWFLNHFPLPELFSMALFLVSLF